MVDSSNAITSRTVEPEENPLSTPVFRHVAQVIFTTFILTFIASRDILVLVMTGVVVGFVATLGIAATRYAHRIAPWLEQIESTGPQ